MKTISLFTGAGGLDLGLEAAGFECAICIEMDGEARATLQANRPYWPLADPGDVHAHRPEEIVEQAGLRPGEAALVCAGPPCQPFSKAAMWVNGELAGMSDARAMTLEAFLGVAEAALPQVLLLENVGGLLASGSNSGLKVLKWGLDGMNRRQGTRYNWTVMRMNAADYGVPQTRKRVFLVADRDGRPFTFPEKTHGPVGASDVVQPYLTAWDAIGDLDSGVWDRALAPHGKWADLLPSIPEGCNYLWHTCRGGGKPLFGWRTRFWSFLLKLAKDRPSWTVPARPGSATGPFHWRNRMLSTRELCRLQTFPDDFTVPTQHMSARRQMGNGVPPLLAEIIGREICSQYFDIHDGWEPQFLPPRRGDPPPPHPVQPVPEKYLSLVGKHPPHPGVGKGPGALARRGVTTEQ